MRRNGTKIAASLVLSALVLVALAGCSSASTPATSTAQASPQGASTPSAAIGKKIFLQGIGSDGQQILTEAPTAAQGAMMLGGGGCASCHGVNGHGGVARAGNKSISGPNVTYATLVKGGYKDTTLQAAIQWSTDQQSSPMDPTMPCWQMSDTDALSTIAYLKTLR